MRIAFVDHISVSGGIIRYGIQLAKALARTNNEVSVTYFTHQKNYLNNRALFDEGASYFRTEVLNYTKSGILANKYLDIAVNKVFRSSWAKKLREEIVRKTKPFDAVYFTCAHASECIEVIPPSFGTFHDLNWKYLFGDPLFSKEAVKATDQQLKKWFKRTNIIVSTPFIRDEIVKFYPEVEGKIHVIFVPGLAEKIKGEVKSGLLADLHLDKPYILYPAHLMPHKNHNNLFHAFWKLLNDPGRSDKYLLVLTGWNSDHFEYGLVNGTGLQIAGPGHFNVRGLGYLSNETMDNVIKGASLVISASLYEAGSGPALDAWVNEVPVIISNIRPHLDQLDFFRIDCETFDPMDTDDMYRKMDYALNNLQKIKQQSIAAAARLDTYTWKDAAQAYLDIFKRKVYEYKDTRVSTLAER
jgi:glycosyltransferase involved in cell wall biosynthesis